jgi:hypothetical protein
MTDRAWPRRDSHARVLADLRDARERLADADRRVLVSRERCRLLRAALTPGPDA